MHYRVRYLLDFDLKLRSGQGWVKNQAAKQYAQYANYTGRLKKKDNYASASYWNATLLQPALLMKLLQNKT